MIRENNQDEDCFPIQHIKEDFPMKRAFALILALVLVISMIPMTTLAAVTNQKDINGYDNATHFEQQDGSFESYYDFGNGVSVVTKGGTVVSSNHPDYKVGAVLSSTLKGTVVAYHRHSYDYEVNRDGHFYRCSCGAKTNFRPHIDPLDAEDGRCTCGYKFMSNAQITTLWIGGVKLSPSFNKEKTEYKGTLTRDMDEITQMTVRTFDARAELELPTKLTLRDGTNVLKFVVTAEDGKTTQTYTITIEK